MSFIGGYSHLNSNLDLLLKDLLAGMGDALTSEQGTIAWIEAYVFAMAQASSLNLISLLSNQFTPADFSVYADRWATLYNIGILGNGIIPDNLLQIQSYVGIKMAQFGTPPTLSNTIQYLNGQLGSITTGGIFIDLEWAPEIQNLASMGPLMAGQIWFSPLSTLFVRIQQPRDNQDNFLMQNNTFFNLANSYQKILQEWQPAYIAVRNMQLLYPGANGSGSYASGVNVVSGSAGSTLITGVGTAFTTDLADVDDLGYQMPIEIVDDTNTLRTYLVAHVGSDTQLTLTTPILNNITGRTYKLLGIELDVPYALDNMLFAS